MTERDDARRGAPSPPRRPHVGAGCYHEGEYWTLVYGGMLCRLRDARGLYYLAHLLRHQGQKLAAADLLKIGASRKARQPGTDPTKPDAERARVLVTKQIRGIVNKIRRHHPSLAHHLNTCIKTSAQCIYLPGPAQPVHWDRD